MENNSTQEFMKTKIVEQNTTMVKGAEYNNIYGVGFVMLLIILIGFILKFKRKKDFIPITTQEEYNQECENIYNDYLKQKDWNMMKEILKDTSFSKNIHNRAKQALKDAGKL